MSIKSKTDLYNHFFTRNNEIKDPRNMFKFYYGGVLLVAAALTLVLKSINKVFHIFSAYLICYYNRVDFRLPEVFASTTESYENNQSALILRVFEVKW